MAALAAYAVEAANKAHEFWRRDSLAIPLFSREVAFQKLTYLHNNPLATHWNLVTDPQITPSPSPLFMTVRKRSLPF